MATIHGRLVSARDRKPLADLRVQAWAAEPAGKRPLGEGASNTDGAFTIEVPARAGEVVFHVLRGELQLLDSTGAVAWNERQGDKPVVLLVPEQVQPDPKPDPKPDPEPDPKPDPQPVPRGPFNVAGVVTSELGVAGADLRVELWDHNVDGATLLAAGATDAGGGYSIDYDPAKLQGKSNADLEVRILDARGQATELVRSTVAYEAPAKAVTDLVVSGAAIRRTPEFARLRATVKPHLREQPLGQVNAAGVTYLAERTGWDARAVAMAAQATTLSAATGIAPEHYYALLRAGAPAERDELHRLSDDQIRAVLQAAIKHRIIGAEHPIDETIKRHGVEAARVLRDVRPAGAASTLGEMLEPHLDERQTASFIDVYRALGDDPSTLWPKLAQAGFDDATIARLRTAGALGRLTAQNAPVVERLLRANEISALDDLATAGFHDPARWKDVVAADVPAGLTAESYAAGLAAQVNLSAPTLVAADLVSKQAVRVQQPAEVAAFLTSAHATHTIGVEPMKTWEGFDALGEQARKDALLVERLYQVSPSNEAMATLSRLGISSAMQIAGYPRDAFIQTFGGDFANTTEARLVHKKATEVHATSLNVATMYLAQRAMPNVYAVTGKTERQKRKAKPDDVVVTATLEDLFTNMDYCACEHCNSVFSPAAYLVELLEFLDVDGLDPSHNPLDILLVRRPDLQHLLLTCENTNVALPYVDIVNEVLEHYVVNGSLATFTGHDMASDAKTADLLADPQFVQDAAYDATKAEVYPSSLPFDMPLAAMRLLFGIWDTTLADALQTFGDAAGARRERLRLNAAEYSILTDAGFRLLPEYFGEPASATIDALNLAVANAKEFCRRMDIAYEDLAAILTSRFVNPSVDLVPKLELLSVNIAKLQDFFDGELSDDDLRALWPAGLDLAPFGGDPIAWLHSNQDAIMHLITLTDVSPEPVECDFATVQLRFALPKPADNALTAIAYQRLHRFIRLWRKLGRPVALTDTLVTTFLDSAPADLTEANIDAAFAAMLDRLANFEALLAELAVSDNKAADWLSLWDATLAADVRSARLATLLKIGTTDLAQLVAITGIDPFASDLGGDDPSMLRFARAWRALKASPLKVADIDYLLRSEDLTGKLAPAEADLLRDIKAMHDALGAAETDIGVAVANPDLNAAKAKMALVYDASVVDRCFALVSQSATYSAPFASVEETLPAPLAQAGPSIELDPFARELTFTSIMAAATQTALDAAADALVLGDMAQITGQAELDAFVAAFKVAVQALRDAGDADLASLAADYPELGAAVAAAEAVSDPAAKAAAVLAAILPELRAALKAQALRTVLAATTKADEDVVAALTSGAGVLHAGGDATRGVLDDFLALEDPLALDADGTFALLVDPLSSGDTILYVAAPAGTTVTLALDGTEVIPATAVGAAGEVRSSVPLTLQTGTLSRLDLTLSGLPAGASARLRWRTKAIAKADVPATRMISGAAVDTARTSLLRVRKAAALQRVLELTAGELTRLAAIDPATRGVLDALDIDGSIAAADVHAQWQRVERLIWFTGLKADHEPDADTFLGLFADPGRTTAQGALLLASVMEWDEPSLTAVLAHHGLALADLAQLDDLRLVTRTMDVVTATLQPAADLLAWAVANPGGTFVQSAKAALKARMTEAAWQQSMQSVSDALRNERRDALVAYILFHHPPAPKITTPDRLYEHFLLDVQMDACMQTSRIVLALSTIQLFVNRCLMNLEANVQPGSIRADRWQWMQRYRVWEANRKVFVYPENWLEPELRDGKSSFFSELESELLKSDITDELAEEAYLSYLKKLDDVAKLEIVAAFLQQGAAGDPDDDVLHVFARTNGKTREHYARRLQAGYWTPWEKLSLAIEGDLVVPVVWRQQLFVFWATILPKPDAGNRDEHPRAIADDAWGEHAKTTTEVTLSWGEYYEGKWTSPKSTEMTDPLRITTSGAYDPSKLVISSRTHRPNANVSERLIFSILYMSENTRAWRVTFTSKHSPPLIEFFKLHTIDDSPGFIAEITEAVKRFNYYLLWEGESPSELDSNSLRLFDRTLEVAVAQPAGGLSEPVSELVLSKTAALHNGFRVRPLLHPVENQWEAPLLYSDEHAVFLLQGDEVVWSRAWLDTFYDVGQAIKVKLEDLPPLYEKPLKPDLGDPVIDPWVDVVNPNFTTIIKDNAPFAFAGATFNARGQVSVPNVDAIGGQ